MILVSEPCPSVEATDLLDVVLCCAGVAALDEVGREADIAPVGRRRRRGAHGQKGVDRQVVEANDRPDVVLGAAAAEGIAADVVDDPAAGNGCSGADLNGRRHGRRGWRRGCPPAGQGADLVAEPRRPRYTW